ncbi:2-C-methyl-D-erythritol 2,4-cyclodiphosphate synthase [Shigella flexneri]
MRIPYEKGLLAHSDGDVALHARPTRCWVPPRWWTSADLFPDTDPWLLRVRTAAACCAKPWRCIQAEGYTLGNVYVTIIAQAPKMLPHIPQMRVFIAEDLATAT